jgi:uncharacterized LabA/DUF88 family protein
MNRRYAVLLDGAFVCKRIRSRSGRTPAAQEILELAGRLGERQEFRSRELLRVFYYDAPPAVGQLRNPIDGSVLNLGRSELHGRAWRLLDELELSADVAIRKGELAVRGWRLRSQSLREIARSRRGVLAEDLEPEIEQKGVDLRIGLDIARLSLLRLVDTIVVVTGDSDMIPAFKFARREGVRVYLDHLGGPVKRDLKAHADIVL